ncbi:MAG: hypothetical protein ABSA82_09450 [Thermacetogeniaceae bacterium]
MFMIVSSYGIQVVPLGNLMHASDPGRVAAQIVTGIGFLGAGVIMPPPAWGWPSGWVSIS